MATQSVFWAKSEEQPGNPKGELFGSGEVDWEDSELLKQVFDEALGFEEDEKYINLPESGRNLLCHELSNYFQGTIYSQIKPEFEDEIGEFNGRIHFRDRRDLEEVQLNADPWQSNEGITHDQDDLMRAYNSLRENPSCDQAIEVLEESARNGIPKLAREVTYRAEQVAKAARAYDEIRGSPAPGVSTELEDAIWAFDKFSGVNLEVDEDVSFDQQIRGNDAMKFVSSTLVQNVYENGVEGDTDVYVETAENGDISVTYESRTEDLPSDIGEDVFFYKGENPEEESFGIPVSSYIVEKFGGEMEYRGDEDTFRLNYTLETAE